VIVRAMTRKKMKSNTAQNGKGDKVRKGLNWKLYWESDYWKSVELQKEKSKKPHVPINISNDNQIQPHIPTSSF
jgi:hypothetical protein